MLVTIKSQPKINYFSPDWRVDTYQTMIDCKLTEELGRLVGSRERALFNQFAHLPASYATPNPQSISSRYAYYNIFDWQDETAVEFKKCVRDNHLAFRSALGLVEEQKVFGKCWMNVLRKGEVVPPHIHSSWNTAHAYLSGFLAVTDNKTKTYFGNPFDVPYHYVDNVPSTMALFPSNILHWSDLYTGDDVRITLAFDLYPYAGGYSPEEDRYPHSPTVEL